MRNGILGGCTMMFCDSSSMKTPFCEQFGSDGGAPGSRGAAGADNGDAVNCCGGGGACGYQHCPALGAGQEGCVRPWAMPNNMNFDTDCNVPSLSASAGSSGACAEQLASSPALIGSYRPQCDERGNYEPVQCHGSTGFCWCVDTTGTELQGSRSRSVVSIETCAALTHAASGTTTGPFLLQAIPCTQLDESCACFLVGPSLDQ